MLMNGIAVTLTTAIQYVRHCAQVLAMKASAISHRTTSGCLKKNKRNYKPFQGCEMPNPAG